MRDPIAKASIEGLERKHKGKTTQNTTQAFHIFQMIGTHSNENKFCELDVLASESHKQHNQFFKERELDWLSPLTSTANVSWSLLLCRESSGSVARASG